MCANDNKIEKPKDNDIETASRNIPPVNSTSPGFPKGNTDENGGE